MFFFWNPWDIIPGSLFLRRLQGAYSHSSSILSHSRQTKSHFAGIHSKFILDTLLQEHDKEDHLKMQPSSFIAISDFIYACLP